MSLRIVLLCLVLGLLVFVSFGGLSLGFFTTLGRELEDIGEIENEKGELDHEEFVSAFVECVPPRGCSGTSVRGCIEVAQIAVKTRKIRAKLAESFKAIDDDIGKAREDVQNATQRYLGEATGPIDSLGTPPEAVLRSFRSRVRNEFRGFLARLAETEKSAEDFKREALRILAADKAYESLAQMIEREHRRIADAVSREREEARRSFVLIDAVLEAAG